MTKGRKEGEGRKRRALTKGKAKRKAEGNQKGDTIDKSEEN